MSDDFISEDKFYRTKKIVMALGLHYLLMTGIYLCFLILLNYFRFNAISEHVDPNFVFYLISFALSGALYLAFEKISVWLWIMAGIVSPILVGYTLILIVIMLEEPLPP